MVRAEDLLARFPSRLHERLGRGVIRFFAVEIARLGMIVVGLGQRGPLVGGEARDQVDVFEGQPGVDRPRVLFAPALGA